MGLVTAAACAGLLSVSAHATSVSATTQVFGLTDNASLLTFSGDTYFVSATTPLHDAFQVGPTPPDVSFNDTVLGGTTFASATAHDPSLDLPYTIFGVNNRGSGNATVQWSLDFVASATGNANLSLEYLDSYTLSNLTPGDSAGVSSSVSLIVDGTTLKSDVLKFFSNVNGNNAGDDFLSLLVPVVAGQHGSLTITVASSGFVNPVPLPAALWLLVSSLLGYGGFFRRLSGAAAA